MFAGPFGDSGTQREILTEFTRFLPVYTLSSHYSFMYSDSSLPGIVPLSTFFFFFVHITCGILVPRPKIEPVPPEMEGQSPNHWTAREFPSVYIL